MTFRDRARIGLSDWRLWTGIAYFFLVAVVVLALSSYARSQQAETDANALRIQHAIEIHAAHAAKVEQCIAGIPTAKEANQFVEGVRIFHIVSVQNAKAVVDQTPKSDPLYAVRLKNYQRLAETIPLVSAIRFPVPTKAQCERG